MKFLNIILFIFLVVISIIFTFTGTYYYNEYKVKQDEQTRKGLYDKILDGASITPRDITINFFKGQILGSPLVFGGAQYPPDNSTSVWDSLQEVGATAIRTDFYIENMVPYNTSIEKYKKNIHNIKDTSTWSDDFIQGRKDAYNKAKKRNMITIGIISYAPSWLTYSHTTRGVPMDWDVYEEIVRKSYSIYRDSIDYVEVWNEPTFSSTFLDVTNSGLTPQEAYAAIFYHAAKAVRDVDNEKNDGKKVFIGGPASDNPKDVSMLETIAQDKRTRQYIDFISYHNYNSPEPSWNDHVAILKKYHMENLPVFITEWNYNPKENVNSPYKTSNPAILFTANKLVDFLKMGLSGANYYSFLPITETEKDTQYLGFYRAENGRVDLLPQARTWRLLSKDIGLGKGKSTIVLPLENITDLNIIGFTNSLSQQGVAIVNASSSASIVNLHFRTAKSDPYVKVNIYYASAENEAKIPVYEGLLKMKSHRLDFPFFLPKETVMGVVFEKEKPWYDLINLFK